MLNAPHEGCLEPVPIPKASVKSVPSWICDQAKETGAGATTQLSEQGNGST